MNDRTTERVAWTRAEPDTSTSVAMVDPPAGRKKLDTADDSQSLRSKDAVFVDFNGRQQSPLDE